jgi:TRAP-type C4-dicarboxylate transport system permease small subunit
MESVIHCFLFCYVNCFCYTFLLMFCWVSVKKWKKLLKIDSFFLYLSGSCINIFWTKNG